MNETILSNSRLLTTKEASQVHSPRPAAIARSERPGLEALAVGARDLARLLGISEATLWRWDASGLLGPNGHKIGGRRLWSVLEIKEWVAAGLPQREAWIATRQANGEKS
jgi:predicted DNA-binding transcriptional regulator AlpA